MSFQRGLVLILFGCFVLALDIFSKDWVDCHLPAMTSSYPFGGVGVFQAFDGLQFSIVHAMNKGAAWGLFSSFPNALVFFRIAVIALLIAYLFLSKPVRAKQFPLILIIVGAIGNVIDFFLYGHVVDMFYFVFWGHPYPVFNIADSAIFCGVALLVLQSFFSKSHAKK